MSASSSEQPITIYTHTFYRLTNARFSTGRKWRSFGRLWPKLSSAERAHTRRASRSQPIQRQAAARNRRHPPTIRHLITKITAQVAAVAAAAAVAAVAAAAAAAAAAAVAAAVLLVPPRRRFSTPLARLITRRVRRRRQWRRRRTRQQNA